MMTSMFGSVCVSIYHKWSVRNLGYTLVQKYIARLLETK